MHVSEIYVSEIYVSEIFLKNNKIILYRGHPVIDEEAFSTSRMSEDEFEQK